MRRVLPAAAAVALSAGLLALPAPALGSAAAAAGPAVMSVSLSAAAVAVRGLDRAPVTVTATMSYPDSGCRADVGGVMLTRTDRAWDRSAPVLLVAPMGCVAVDGNVHTLRAVVYVPSSAHGSWRLSCVVLRPTCYDPSTAGLPDATLRVAGTHRPRLRLTATPQPLPYPQRTVTLSARASYDDTNEPLVGQLVNLDAVRGGGWIGRTDRTGRFSHAVTLGDTRAARADLPMGAPRFDEWKTEYAAVGRVVVVRPAVLAKPAKDVVRHGTNVSIEGHAKAVAVPSWGFRPRVKVYLQRVVGRRWRTVSEAEVRPSGRFTLLATPPKGLNTYRVSMPPQHDLAAATSTRFTIRGT
jgi:hypothetical protein